MVKIKFKNAPKKDSQENRVRGIKPNRKNINKNTIQKTNNYQNPNAPLTVNETNLKYTPEDRQFILIGIVDLFEKVEKEVKLPENLIFSTIAFFDNYIEKTEKSLSKKEMVSALYACLDILDKYENINVFSSPIFKPYYNPINEYEILETVDLEVYPDKLYDHFQKFYYPLTQTYQHNKKIMDFLNEFKKIFRNFAFFLLFHNESQKKTALSNFISCLVLSYEKCKINEQAKILEVSINQLKENNNYSDNDCFICKQLIEEAVNDFNSIYKRIKNNK